MQQVGGLYVFIVCVAAWLGLAVSSSPKARLIATAITFFAILKTSPRSVIQTLISTDPARRHIRLYIPM
jgi:hypothetical protein